MSNTINSKGTSRIFYGWWIVLAGATMMLLMGTFSYYGMGVFLTPILETNGWQAAQIATALSIARLEGGVMAPLMGYLIDRYGPRVLMIVGVIGCGAGYILLSRAGQLPVSDNMQLLYFYIVYILLVQGGVSAGMGNAPTAAVANWFVRKRATAMGIVNLGLSLGGILATPLAWVISKWGWRTAMLGGGSLIWALGIPLATLVRHRPEDYGLLPDGDKPDPSDQTNTSSVGQQTQNPNSTAVEFSAKQAIKTMAFWAIALMFSSRMFVTGSVALFLVTMLQERGMSHVEAAQILSLMALLGMPGRVGFAWLGDRFDKRKVIAFCFVFQSTGLILFTLIPGPVGIACFLILYSPTYSGVLPLIPALQADYFGRQRFATIRGLMAPVGTISMVSSPIVVSVIRDQYGSYDPAFMFLGVLNILALVFIAITRKPILSTPV
jgi:sugar phosphate permease